MRRFRPPIWAVIGTVLMLGLLVSLGVWQLQRGWSKQEIADTYASSGEQPAPVRVSPEMPVPAEGKVVLAEAEGRFDSERQLLLDHQTNERRPGYRVWTVLRGEDFDVLVDRGWVAASGERSQLPQIRVSEQQRAVTGYWRSLPEPALRLDADPCAEATFPRVVTYPSAVDVRCLLGEQVLAGLLLMDASSPDGFVRDWSMPDPVPPTRHYGYAAQWFAFAATLLFLFIKLNLQPKRPE